MSDMDDDDLSRFLEEDDDAIKPIDMGEKKPEPKKDRPEFAPEDLGSESPQAETPAEKPPESKGRPEFTAEDMAGSGDIPQPVFNDPVSSSDDLRLSDDLMADIEKESERREELQNGGARKEKPKYVPKFDDADDDFDKPEVPEHLMAENKEINYIKRGEYVDLKEKRPGLNGIVIGAGWDQRAFEEEPLDLDISLFFLNRDDMTREDGDFIFYNNAAAFEGAVRHNYDSRTGAGDGDDETINVELNGVPFDLLKVVVVLSIYDPDFEGHHFGKVKNVYMRIVDKSDGLELFRYKLEDDLMSKGNALIIGTLIREGPKWIFEANSSDTINGGLAKYATDYGIIVKELQSTGINEDGATPKKDDED